VRIAFLCKRRYMSKDVILDRYGRLYEIPRQLARRGHEVRCYCLGYRNEAEGEWRHESGADSGQFVWESRSLGRSILPRLLHYPWRLLRSVGEFRPDALIGASDIPHAALTQWLAKRLDIPYAIDLYDNFEGYGQARIPGMVGALRRAARNADLVVTTSELLRDFVATRYRATGKVLALPSAIDKAIFHPRDEASCRQALDLPPHAPLIGTAGGLLKSRGINTLYEAWPRVVAEFPDARLVLAGPYEKNFPPPARPDVVHLGCLPHRDTATLFNALDVGVIYLKDTLFGRYCFPQKAYEMLACRLPVVAADVGAMPALLKEPARLYCPEDSADLASAILDALRSPSICETVIRDWQDIVRELDDALCEACATTARRTRS